MLTAEELLQDGEVFLGAYNIEIARWTNDHWSPTMPPIYAILSDHRLILQPQTRKHKEPAIIPTSYVSMVKRLNSPRHGIMLFLRTGHRIGIFVAADPEETLLHHMQHLKPPKREIKFDGEFSPSTVQRLIEYLSS